MFILPLSSHFDFWVGIPLLFDFRVSDLGRKTWRKIVLRSVRISDPQTGVKRQQIEISC